jgi:hypothetical protein
MVVLAVQCASLGTSQVKPISIAQREAYLRWAFTVEQQAVAFLGDGSRTRMKMELAKRAKL